MPEIRNSPKRVLIVAVDFKPLISGIAEYAYHMAHGFMTLDTEVQILSPYYIGVETNDDKLGMQVKRTYPAYIPGKKSGVAVKMKNCASLAGLAATMLKMRKVFQPHIIYFPSMYPFAGFFPHLKGSMVTTFHSGELSMHCRESRFAAMNKYILRRSCNNSALILANSNYTKNLLEELGANTSKIFVTGCGVDWERFGNVPDTNETKSKLGFSGKKIILSLARLDEHKGFDNVLKCIPNIRKKFPNVLYIIAGDGPRKENLEKLVACLNLQDYVRMVGPISDASVVNYMAACDVFAMPNRKTTDGSIEGFGIVLLEANCCGKPVIAGRSGGVVDAVEHNKTGLLVNPYSQQDIEDAIETLLGNPQLAVKLGQQGRERVQKHFKWTFIAERTCRHILNQVG